MTYTFDEKEIQCFLDWAWPAECEIGLSEFEVKLRDKLRKILWKSFDEMSNSEKIDDFLKETRNVVNGLNNYIAQYEILKENK